MTETAQAAGERPGIAEIALAVFTSARQALWAATELQTRVAQESLTNPSMAMKVGIGIDAGEAIPVHDGYRGAALNLASLT